MEVDTCRHLIEELLSSYVDGELDNHTAQSLEIHLQMCPPCAAFLRTFMATKRCVREQLVHDQMPVDCEASLWNFLQRETGVAPDVTSAAAIESKPAIGCACTMGASAPSQEAASEKIDPKE